MRGKVTWRTIKTHMLGQIEETADTNSTRIDKAQGSAGHCRALLATSSISKQQEDTKSENANHFLRSHICL